MASKMFLLYGILSSIALQVTYATPVRLRDIPTYLRPRQSEATPHPLDYAPDFSKDPFPPWPPVKNDDGSDIEVQNWRGTKLFGWKGCKADQQAAIVEAMQHFHKLADQKELWENIDWDSPAAKDIWNHATDDKKVLLDNIKPQIQQIFQAAREVYDKNWWVPPYIYEPPWVSWRTLWIRVQCSPGGDDSGQCGDDVDMCPNGEPLPEDQRPDMEAYSDPLGWYSKITFCKLFFAYPSLETAISTAKNTGGEYAKDLWNYQNRARVLFHEITHLNYFMNAPKKSPYVDDIKVRYKSGKKEFNQPAYGPDLIKVLANYERVGKGGFYTQRNADSYAWFAMAKYIEGQVGRYPINPIIPKRPIREPTDGDGRNFAAGADASGDTEDNADDGGDETEIAVDPKHTIPGCVDHPVQGADTSFGVDTVNDATKEDCDSNKLSGVLNNVFAASTDPVTAVNVYDNFCKEVDGTVNSKKTYDAHGNPTDAPASKRLRKRTPPANPDSWDGYTFELSWETDDAGKGCGQTVESCRNAFSKLAGGLCGHSGGEQNGLTTDAKLTLPGCGSYSWHIAGGEKQDEPAPPPEEPEDPAPPPEEPKEPAPPPECPEGNSDPLCQLSSPNRP